MVTYHVPRDSAIRSQPQQRRLLARPQPPAANRAGDGTKFFLGKPISQQNMLPRGKVASHRILKSREEHAGWLEVEVSLYNVHPETTTWHLYERFKEEGNVVYIELGEDGHASRNGFAKIRFAQPPTVRPFWVQNVVMPNPIGHGLVQLRAQLRESRRSFQVQSCTRNHIWYPEVITMAPETLEFGLMHQMTTMMVMQSFHAETSSQSIKFILDVRRKEIVVRYTINFKDPRTPEDAAKSPNPHGCNDRTADYKFAMPFKQLTKLSKINVDDQHWAIVVALGGPPRVFRKVTQTQLTHKDRALQWSEIDTWYRQTDIMYDPLLLRTTPLSLRSGGPTVDIGRWTTYRLIFRKDQENSMKFQIVQDIMRDWNVEVVSNEDFRTIPAKVPLLWSSPSSSLETTEQQWFTDETSEGDLPFDVRYQLEVCVSQGLINEQNISKEFLNGLRRQAQSRRKERLPNSQDSSGLSDIDSVHPSSNARTILEYVAEHGVRVFNPLSILHDKEALAFAPDCKIPHYCALVRKVTITPTQVLLSSPTVETTNRVLRKYSAFGDRFLRVQFTDEKSEGAINSSADKTINDELYTRVYRTLKNGIDIGDRHYEFLAFGNSQFRENGAYFFCPNEHLSCNSIRLWMGNFSDIKTVAKYAARLGQCFSTTRAIHAARPYLRTLDDVERNGYCFTDGVGKISPMMAGMIATELNLPESQLPPSAFQFRMGGCKGVLTVAQDVKGQEVYIRKSQQKFTAAWNGLEIIRYSRFSTATLNRQTITILSALGVPDEVFNNMLVNQLKSYRDAMEEKSVALEMLGRYIDDNHMTMTIAGMVLDGFMGTREPFLMSLMHLWRSWSIKLLKEKAKIIVEQGAFILGVTDETGTLKGHASGSKSSLGLQEQDLLPEIFIQVPDRTSKGQYIIIEGICVIGRNPSLHPGDIRVVRAVDCEALHHLRDVVVFPQQGDRDLPSMLSGGDLDGDDFFVIWDSALIPREINAIPMDLDVVVPKPLDRDVSIHDLIKFFVVYMKNDSLPTIAHAHLALSDYLDHGVKELPCIELAALHSKAVDYVKSGIAAEMPKRLRPRKWPHFMEKSYKPKDATYVSEKVLGQLYDKVDRIDFVPQYENAFDTRILKAFVHDAKLLKAARQIKSKYDTAMRRIMAQREISTEFEVWSTFVMSKPRVGSDYKIQEEMGSVSAALQAQFRNVVYEFLGTKDFQKLAPFVAAMYRVTHEEMRIALHECYSKKIVNGREVPGRTMEPKYMPLISFPWLFHEILGKIATGVQQSEELVTIDLASTFLRNVKDKGRRGFANNRNDDVLMTEHGVVHRGEELDLFKLDEADASGGEIEQAYGPCMSGELDHGVLADDEAAESEREHSTGTISIAAHPHKVSDAMAQTAPSSRILTFTKSEDTSSNWSSDQFHPFAGLQDTQELDPASQLLPTSSGLLDMQELVDGPIWAPKGAASSNEMDQSPICAASGLVAPGHVEELASGHVHQQDAVCATVAGDEQSQEPHPDHCGYGKYKSRSTDSQGPYVDASDSSEDVEVVLGSIRSFADKLRVLASS